MGATISLKGCACQSLKGHRTSLFSLKKTCHDFENGGMAPFFSAVRANSQRFCVFFCCLKRTEINVYLASAGPGTQKGPHESQRNSNPVTRDSSARRSASIQESTGDLKRAKRQATLYGVARPEKNKNRDFRAVEEEGRPRLIVSTMTERQIYTATPAK